MNIAIPVWDGRISPVFDAARWLMVVEVEEGVDRHRRDIFLAEASPLQRARRLADLGVDVLICGAISRSCVDIVKALKITVIPWVAGDVDEVLPAYLVGKLPSPQFSMPGR